MTHRRQFLAAGSLAGLLPLSPPGGTPPRAREDGARVSNPIALSTYSLWRFRNDELRDLDRCIDLADEFGFDGIEFLLYQVGQNDLLSRSRGWPTRTRGSSGCRSWACPPIRDS